MTATSASRAGAREPSAVGGPSGAPRERSLFWTFAGFFLAVLTAAALLQALAIGAALRPAMRRWAAARVETDLQETASEIAERLAVPDGPPPLPFRHFLTEMGPVLLAYRAEGEPDVPDLLELRRANRPPEGERPARPDGPRPEPPPLGERRGRRLRHADPPPEEIFHRALTVVAREPVVVAGERRGEVIALLPDRRLPWPFGRAGLALLFAPVAILVAGLAGLLMLKLLLGRLSALEALAGRVAEGDLDARVPNPGGDEIGRLGRRLNAMTESLSEARVRVEAADAERRRFLADVTHELATPLTSIRGFAETLLSGRVSATDEERRTYLANVLEEAQRMDLLLQDLLELTRLEGGSVPLALERLDWAALCENTVERFRPRFREAGLALAWEGAGPAWVRADGRRLVEVLENLLVNALRYVPSGGRVRVRVEPAGAAGEGGRAKAALVVADDGPGFPPEDLPHVFDRFYRGQRAGTTAGTGLGLAIVREIARRHGGAATAGAAPEGGASLRVEIPAVESGEGG